jgi:hypothetical protein
MWEKIKAFVAAAAKNPGAAARSALRTVVAVAGALAVADQFVSVPAEAYVWVTAAAGFLRTVIAILDKSNTEFGFGA